MVNAGEATGYKMQGAGQIAAVFLRTSKGDAVVLADMQMDGTDYLGFTKPDGAYR